MSRIDIALGPSAGRKLQRAALYLSQNTKLVVGLAILAMFVGLPVIGLLFRDPDLAYPLSVAVAKPPSPDLPFGSDTAGRDLLAVMSLGTLLTLKVGLIAGSVGVAVGTALAFTAAYFGGLIDRTICVIVDILLTVPGLMVLIVLASSIPGRLSTTDMALVIAALAWREPTRQIRAQALTMRTANYVQIARLSGQSNLSIIFKEMVPNLLPYLGASLVSAVSAAILASVGLEALGLGSVSEPSLGMTIYWMMMEGAFFRGMWWWILAPVVVLMLLFIALYMISVGLDELANPRLRHMT